MCWQGARGSRRVIRDRHGRIVDDVWAKESEAGTDVTLAIDSRVQFIAYEALRAAIERHQAKAGAVVVADVNTGEIIALANEPTYDPNDRSTVLFERVRNRVLTDQFEPGSTMKPFAIAKALDMGLVDPLTTIQTSPGKLTIGDRTIGDTHDYGLLTVAEVVAKSSNIGTAKIALEISPQTLYETYSELGFGNAPKIGFPGATWQTASRQDLAPRRAGDDFLRTRRDRLPSCSLSRRTRRLRETATSSTSRSSSECLARLPQARRSSSLKPHAA